MPPRRDLRERFDEKITKTCGCWLWRAGTQRDGYGTIRTGDKKSDLAHRVSWRLHCGEIPTGLYVLHKCDTPACVNPEHLFLGTQFDNMADMKAKGREADRRGVRHPGAKLTEAQIKQIWKDTRTYVEIAESYGVGSTHIGKIKRRELWSHIA